MNLADLRKTAEAATPGPWRWSGQKGRYIDLTTVGRGIATVMGFARLGMQGAQPVFFDRDAADLDGHYLTGTYRKGNDLAVKEVEYRGDIDHLDNADARFIAAANPATVLALIAVAEAATTIKTTEWAGGYRSSEKMEADLTAAFAALQEATE